MFEMGSFLNIHVSVLRIQQRTNLGEEGMFDECVQGDSFIKQPHKSSSQVMT